MKEEFGFGTIVISLVKAAEWGWIQPRQAPFEVLGFSPTIPLVLRPSPSYRRSYVKQ